MSPDASSDERFTERMVNIEKCGDEWRVCIPPRGPEDLDGTLAVAPYGRSFWPTREDALAFVELVTKRRPDVDITRDTDEIAVDRSTSDWVCDACGCLHNRALGRYTPAGGCANVNCECHTMESAT
jgi:hypothetical protein